MAASDSATKRMLGDKRIIRRTPRRIMVRYGVNGPEKMAFTRNISEGGLFLQTNSVLKPGTTIQVEFELLDRPFSMWAEVMWARKAPPQLAQVVQAGMGIRFLEPDAEFLETYGRWTRELHKV